MTADEIKQHVEKLNAIKCPRVLYHPSISETAQEVAKALSIGRSLQVTLEECPLAPVGTLYVIETERPRLHL